MKASAKEVSSEALYVSLEFYLERYAKSLPEKDVLNLQRALKIIERHTGKGWAESRNMWKP